MRKLIAALLIAGSPASAFSGNVLLDMCEADVETEAVRVATCVGYISGVTSGMTVQYFFSMDKIGEFADGDPGFLEIWGTLQRSNCIPEDVTIGQERDVVIKYLKDNPALRNEDAKWLVFLALAEAFPCE